ncbi:hypothetical protein Tco_0743076 [Tanacetum coccineum]
MGEHQEDVKIKRSGQKDHRLHEEVEEKMTVKEVDGETIEKIETKIIAKDGTVTKFPRKFPRYETSAEEPVKQPKTHDLYGIDDEELERNEEDSDLESTARSEPKRFELEDTCESGVRFNT